MQGVDRHDQLRGRFSLADGHSFQKWHKKLAMAMIDIAKCNAYICDGLARGSRDESSSGDPNDTSSARSRDSHRSFVVSLIRELFNGDWKSCVDSDRGMASTTGTTAAPTVQNVRHTIIPEASVNPPLTCAAKESWLVMQGRSRSKRKCTVCKFKCRSATKNQTIVKRMALRWLSAHIPSTPQNHISVSKKVGRAGRNFIGFTCPNSFTQSMVT
jgi:hypothetical protein